MICASHFMLLQIMFTATPEVESTLKCRRRRQIYKISAKPISFSQLSALNSQLFQMSSAHLALQFHRKSAIFYMNLIENIKYKGDYYGR